jgi:hypothetical protein
MGELAMNFVRGMVSEAWTQQANWYGNAMFNKITAAAVNTVAAVSLWHDQFLNSRDPVVGLRAALALWIVSILGRYLSIWSLATLAFLLAFTLPISYQTHRDTLSFAFAKTSSAIKVRRATCYLRFLAGSPTCPLIRRHDPCTIIYALLLPMFHSTVLTLPSPTLFPAGQVGCTWPHPQA